MAAPRERGDFLGHAAAVGIAEHDGSAPASAAAWIVFSAYSRIGLPAVEEVLGVVDHFAAGGAQESHAVGDHRQVFFQRDAQHLA